MAIKWIEPKTDWGAAGRFNISDFNRIRNNLMWLHEEAEVLYTSFEIDDMGDEMTSFASYWDVDHFNAFEGNLEKINKRIYEQELGESQRFYENAPFIKWDELNRIESACLKMKNLLSRQRAGMRRIPFRLGTFKEVRF